MPGFTIHIAIAKQYIAKHENEIKDEEEFIKGSIAPDLNKNFDGPSEDKSKSHYGKWGKYEVTTYLDQFLKDEEVDMTQDYWKGYFCHLLSDHYFYNKYFKKEHQEMIKNNDRFYYDYDCLNKELIERYKIELSENIRNQINFYDEEPKYLKIPKLVDFIDSISNLNLQEQSEIISHKGMDGLE